MVSFLVLLAASALLLILHLVRRRRSGFATFASRRGLRYETSAASLPQNLLSGLSLFQGNWEMTFCHLVHGRYGDSDVYMFEFSAKTGPQMNDPETSQTVVIVRMEGLQPFRLKGYADAGPEEAAPRFSSDLRKRTSKWKVEGNRQGVSFWQPSRVIGPEEAGAFLDEVLGMARNLVAHQKEAPA